MKKKTPSKKTQSKQQEAKDQKRTMPKFSAGPLYK